MPVLFQKLIQPLLSHLKHLSNQYLRSAHRNHPGRSQGRSQDHSQSTHSISTSNLTKTTDADNKLQDHLPVDRKMSSQLNIKAVEAEIRSARQFSLAEAIGREGGSFLRSNSTIPRPLQAANIISHFIQTHASEPTGPVATTLQSWSDHDIRLIQQLDMPLNALAEIISSLLCEPTTFYEFARQIAIAQSQLIGSRPYFQQPNQPPHPEADYTHDTIKAELMHLQQQLEAQL